MYVFNQKNVKKAQKKRIIEKCYDTDTVFSYPTHLSRAHSKDQKRINMLGQLSIFNIHP